MNLKQFSVKRGFSLFDLLLIVAATVGIIAVILPALSRPRVYVNRASCTNNLKQIGIGIRGWSLDNNDLMPMQVSVTNGGVMELGEQASAFAIFLVMSNDLVTPKILFCPEESNQQRRMASVWGTITNGSAVPLVPTNTLSYFVGLDATNGEPQKILTGDDHFLVAGVKPKPGLLLLQTNAPVEWRNERHPKQGNVAFADASVQSLSTPTFRAALVQTGLATNRLAMP